MISAEQLAGIATWLREHGAGEEILPALRQSHPDVHFTWCMDDDIGIEAAAVEDEAFNLYLVDGREHCLKFTRDADAATGVVVAEITDEE